MSKLQDIVVKEMKVKQQIDSEKEFDLSLIHI